MFSKTILTLIAFLICTPAYANQVVLRWDSNLEEDLAGYKLHYGNRSGDYPWYEDVALDACYGDTCEVTLDLPSGQWHCAVTAYDISGNESSFSEEVVGIVGSRITELMPASSYPGRVVRIIGQGFGEPEKGNAVHINSKIYDAMGSKIMLWTDSKIKVRVPSYKCKWFKGKTSRRRKVWVTCDGMDSNIRRFRVLKPESCN